MPDELPPLDKFVVSGYAEGHRDYPVVIVVKDSRALGYTLPSAAALCPDDRFATHQFIGVTPTSIDNRVIWTYEILPGPTIAGESLTADVRGRKVDVAITTVAAGTDPATGDGVISSVVTPIDSVRSQRTTISVATLPTTEVSAFWDFVPIPLLVFDINHVIFCNNTPFGTLVSTPVTSGGSSQLRKHRKTVSYSNTYPNPDLSASAPVPADVRYQGKFISFSYSNVLNDALAYEQEFFQTSSESGCGWTEEYDIAASVPSATTFAAGAWYVRSYRVEEWGESGWKSTLIEYYSAPGNPAVV